MSVVMNAGDRNPFFLEAGAWFTASGACEVLVDRGPTKIRQKIGATEQQVGPFLSDAQILIIATAETTYLVHPAEAWVPASLVPGQIGDLSGITVADYTAFRASTSTAKQIEVTGYLGSAVPSGIAGTFVRDMSGSGADNGGTIIVRTDGARYRRIFDGVHFLAEWWGIGMTVADNEPLILAAQQAITANGYGTLVFRNYSPAIEYLDVARPVELQQGVSLEFPSEYGVVIRKQNTAVSSTGVDCVVQVASKSRFYIKNLRTWGNRVGNADPALCTATSDGLYLSSCSNFVLDHPYNQQSRYGLRLKSCFIGKINKPTSLQCQSYAFVTENSCTTLTFTSPLNYACGGGFSMTATLYSSIVSAANDYSDAGGDASDPFAASGYSGGNYLSPAYLFKLSACQGISILSPGTENSFSFYFYGEGAFATVISPHAFNLTGANTSYRAWQLRGSGASEVKVISQYGSDVTNPHSVQPTRQMFYVETPAVQKFRLSNAFNYGSTWGKYAYSASGIEFENTTTLLRLDQQTMVVGGDTPLIFSTDGTAVITAASGVKTLTIDCTVNGTSFRQPLPLTGFIKVEIAGAYTGAAPAIMRLVEDDGSATTLVTWNTTSGQPISVAEYYTLSGTKPKFFEIIAGNTTDAMTITSLTITLIK